MRLRSGYAGQLVLELEAQEASILSNLVGQLISLLQSYSPSTLEADPLLSRLEVGGNEQLSDDPAIARLLPNAYEDDETANEFRRVTELGLINHKIEDAMVVSTAISAGSPENASVDSESGTDVTINAETLGPWIRTATAIRLSIAARLGIDTDETHELIANDPEHENTMRVYNWLAAIIDLIVRYSAVVGDEPIE